MLTKKVKSQHTVEDSKRSLRPPSADAEAIVDISKGAIPFLAAPAGFLQRNGIAHRIARDGIYDAPRHRKEEHGSIQGEQWVCRGISLSGNRRKNVDS